MSISDQNKTDANFWCNFSAEQVYNSSERRAKSVEALKAVIVWAFALFSVGGFVVTLFGSLKDYSVYGLICFGIAFFMLTLSYHLAGKAQYPVMKNYVQDDPSEIADAFNEAVEKQTGAFKRAAATTAVGFFFLALGILIQFGSVKKEQAQIVQPVTVAIVKTGVEKRSDSIFVPVTVQWKKNAPIYLSYVKLEALKENGAIQQKETPIYSQIFYADSLGRLFHSHLFLPKDSIKNLVVKAGVLQQNADTLYERIISIKISLGQ